MDGSSENCMSESICEVFEQGEEMKISATEIPNKRKVLEDEDERI